MGMPTNSRKCLSSSLTIWISVTASPLPRQAIQMGSEIWGDAQQIAIRVIDEVTS